MICRFDKETRKKTILNLQVDVRLIYILSEVGGRVSVDVGVWCDGYEIKGDMFIGHSGEYPCVFRLQLLPAAASPFVCTQPPFHRSSFQLPRERGIFIHSIHSHPYQSLQISYPVAVAVAIAQYVY